MRIKTCAMLTNIDKAVFPLICAWFMLTMVFKAYFASLSYFNKPDGIILPSESRIVYIQISDLKISLWYCMLKILKTPEQSLSIRATTATYSANYKKIW